VINLDDLVLSKMTSCEKDVAVTLQNLGVEWRYEQPVFVWDENKRPRVWAPDFYLVQYGIYVEVCGSETFNYEYRKQIFAKNGYQVIFLHLYKRNRLWKGYLIRSLKSCIESRNRMLSQLNFSFVKQ
jgi:hypothetical protein